MSLFTGYSGWLDGIRDWLDVDDYTDAQIQAFLALGQIRLNRDLMSSSMEKSVDVTIDDTTEGLPIDLKTAIPDFSKIRWVSPSWSNRSSDSLAYNEYIKAIKNDGINNDRSGVSYYSIDSKKLYISPMTKDGDVISVGYYVMVPLISDTIDENIFTEFHYDALLYSAALEAAPYMSEDERIPVWQGNYQIIVEQTNNASSKEKLGSVPLVRQINVYQE